MAHYMDTATLAPYERLALDWLKRPRDMTLGWYEDAHKCNGFLFSTPDFYVMGRPVMKYSPVERILDVTHRFDTEMCDSWYVFQMAGDVRKAWSILPWELPWICWQRDKDLSGELRFCETRRMMRLSGVDA